MPTEPRAQAAPFVLRRARVPDARALVNFHLRNGAHLSAVSPRQPDGFGVDFMADKLRVAEADFEHDRRVSMVIVDERSDRIVGFVNFMNIIRGAMQGSDLSYAIDAELQGRGLMHWAVSAAIQFAFGPRREMTRTAARR